jgi:hypothetical protein
MHARTVVPTTLIFLMKNQKFFFFEKVKNDPEWAPPWLAEHAGTGQKNVLLQPTRLMGYFGAVG